MFSSILLVLGVAVLAMALRSFRHPISQKLGLICILITSFLIGYLPSGNPVIGLLVASLWLFLPWLEILTRIRTLRFPLDRTLRQRTPPSRELFPNLEELTGEIEQEGFELIVDVGWDWEVQKQFLRLFHRTSDQTQAALCLIDQGDVAFYYLSLMTRALDGRILTTWNYPFSYALKFLPESKIHRVRATLSFAEMCESHSHFLQRTGVGNAAIMHLDPDQIQQLLQSDLRAQISHNVKAGLLIAVNDSQVRYTWRGMFYLWFRFLIDFVRL
jgi:hypothetical protein